MTAIKSQNITSLLNEKYPSFFVYLFYGPDLGIVTVRALSLARRFIKDTSDVFNFSKLDESSFLNDPHILTTQINTYPLFGGVRGIMIQGSPKGIEKTISEILESPEKDVFIIVESGNLSPKSELRKICEKSPHAASIPCYRDEEKELKALIQTTLKLNNLKIDKNAEDILISLLGENRLTSRGELEKLILYTHGNSSITLGDIEEIISDSSSVALDNLIDAVFLGQLKTIEEITCKVFSENIDPNTLIAATQRHAFLIYDACKEKENRKRIEDILNEYGKNLFFKRKKNFEIQINQWNTSSLLKGITLLQETSVLARQHYPLSALLVSRALWSISFLKNKTLIEF